MAEYIDRDTVIKKIRRMPRTINPDLVQYSLVKGIISNIEQADAVPVVHGKWIEEKYETISIERHRKINNIKNKCSICEKSNGRRKTNFCPNCGAKMDL